MSSPQYDLAVQGVKGFARFGRILSLRKIARDPLSGLVDGTNTTFFSQYYPILTSGSLVVYTSGSAVSGTADYDTGEITLDAAPTVQPEATYTFVPYTATQMLQFLIQGFEEMETQWVRGLKLVDALGLPADEDSAQLLIADSSGSEPVGNGVNFTDSVIQVAFLMACTEYAYIRSHLYESAIGDFMYKESRGGSTIDKQKRPKNLEAALAAARSRMLDALKRAQDQFYQGGSQYGAYISNPATAMYMTDYEWQTDSKEQNIRLNYPGYHISRRPFSLP